MILVFANQKGGVGKTTMCMAFANYLSKRGVNTLVVDVDRQRNFLFQRKTDMEAFTGQEGDYNVEAADVETREEAAELMETIIELDGVVLIDSPGNVTEDGLIPVFAHADYIICPFKYEKKCLESTGNFISVINKLKHQIEGMKASLIFVPNIIDKRIGVTEELEWWKETNKIFEDYGMLAPMIPYKSSLMRVNSFALTSIQEADVKKCFDYIIKKIKLI